MVALRLFVFGLLFYSAESSTCGTVFVEDNGVVTSPSYPNPYPADLSCMWFISVAHNKIIRLTFEDFDTERSTVVTVHDLRDTHSVEFFRGSGRIYSFKTMVSTFNQMEIRMNSVGNSGRKGFKLSYSSVSRCRNPPYACNGDISVGRYPTVSGAVATVMCDKGYTLIGPEQLQCDSDGIWTPTHKPACTLFRTSCSIPKNAALVARPLLDMDFYHLTSRVDRVSAILALPDGSALMDVQYLRESPQKHKIYLVREDGTIKTMFSCLLGSCGNFEGLVRHNDMVYGFSNKIYQFHLTADKLEHIDTFNPSSGGYRGAHLAKNLLVVTAFHQGEVFTFDLVNHHKQVTVTGLRKPHAVAVDGAGENAIVAVAEYEGHQIKLFDSKWNLIRTIGSKGKGDGQLWYPNHVTFVDPGRLLVTDSNFRVSEFRAADGSFAGHWLTRPDLYFNGMSFCYPYLWLKGRLNRNSGVLHGLRFKMTQD